MLLLLDIIDALNCCCTVALASGMLLRMLKFLVLMLMPAPVDDEDGGEVGTNNDNTDGDVAAAVDVLIDLLRHLPAKQ